MLDVSAVYKPKTERGRPSAKAKKRAGKLTTNAAILKALDDGAQKDFTTIANEVEKVKGKVSKPSIRLGLAKLKKDKKISNPERGYYAKA